MPPKPKIRDLPKHIPVKLILEDNHSASSIPKTAENPTSIFPDNQVTTTATQINKVPTPVPPKPKTNNISELIKAFATLTKEKIPRKDQKIQKDILKKPTDPNNSLDM